MSARTRHGFYAREGSASLFKAAQQHRSKEDFVKAILNGAQSDTFTLEQHAEINLMPGSAEVTSCADRSQVHLKRVHQIGESSGKQAWAGTVHRARRALAESFVRTLVIVFLLEMGEGGLLCPQALFRGRSGFILQREMKALVAAILLWAAALNSFRRDAKPNPPDR